jgi:hypothetical protein
MIAACYVKARIRILAFCRGNSTAGFPPPAFAGAGFAGMTSVIQEHYD